MTRATARTTLWLAAAGLCALVGTLSTGGMPARDAWAQAPEPDAPPAGQEPDGAGENAPDDGAPRNAGNEDDAAPPEVEDDVFIPTEEIPADEEVTFPVNI